MKIDTSRATLRRLFVLVFALLLISQAAASVFAWTVFRDNLLPELDRKAATAAVATGARIKSAVDLGIPLAGLIGMTEFLDQMIMANDGIEYAAVTAPDGAVLFTNGQGLPPQVAEGMARQKSSLPGQGADGTTYRIDIAGYSNTVLPLLHEGAAIGTMHVGVSAAYLQQQLEEIFYDIAIVMLVSLLVAFEMLLFVVTVNLSGPVGALRGTLDRFTANDFTGRVGGRLRGDMARMASRVNEEADDINHRFSALADRVVRLQREGMTKAASAGSAAVEALQKSFKFSPADGDVLRAGGVLDVRIFTFLFMFGDMVSRPFFPLFVRDRLPSGTGMSDDILMSLPITLFMAVVALTMPRAGTWSESFGPRRTFAFGALLSIFAFAGLAMNVGYWDLVAWRMVSGVGYAMMFMACQTHVIGNTSARDRGNGVALFVGGIMVAEICGPAIGGIVADRIGIWAAFLFGAGMTLLAAVLAVSRLDSQGGPVSKRPPLLRTALTLAGNPLFMVTIICAAVPAKLLLTGVLVFLTPILLDGFDATTSEIGRILMIYGIANVVLAPMFARLADRMRAHWSMVAAGSLLSALALVPVAIWPGTFTVILAVTAIGIGQAMSISAQVVVVEQLTVTQAARHGHGAILGLYRLFERAGGAAGPFLVAALSSTMGPVRAMAVLGVVGTALAVLFAVIMISAKMRAGGDAPAQTTAAGE